MKKKVLKKKPAKKRVSASKDAVQPRKTIYEDSYEDEDEDEEGKNADSIRGSLDNIAQYLEDLVDEHQNVREYLQALMLIGEKNKDEIGSIDVSLMRCANEFIIRREMYGRIRFRVCIDLVTDYDIRSIAEARGEYLNYCFDVLRKHLSRLPIENEKIPLGP